MARYRALDAFLDLIQTQTTGQAATGDELVLLADAKDWLLIEYKFALSNLMRIIM